MSHFMSGRMRKSGEVLRILDASAVPARISWTLRKESACRMRGKEGGPLNTGRIEGEDVWFYDRVVERGRLVHHEYVLL
jgi:hypothetical protein